MQSIFISRSLKVMIFSLMIQLFSLGVGYAEFGETINEAETAPSGLATESAVPDINESIPNPVAVGRVLAGELTEANAAWWGFDPGDSTDYLQAAIDSGVPRLIVPNMGGRDWVIRPIYLRSDLEVVFEEGVVVAAKKGEFLATSDSLFNVLNVDDLVLRGIGSGATLRMNKDDYTKPPYEHSEHRMGIRISSGKNVQVIGLTIRDTGGDGIYIGGASENIVIRNVVADNNRRQGMSVISVRNLLVEDSVFKNTIGTSPQSGIDFEPNNPNNVLENITVRNSLIENNEGTGIIVSVGRLSLFSNVSIVIENVLITGGGYGFRYNGAGAAARFQPQGQVTIRNCIIEHTQYNAVRIVNKAPNAMSIVFEDCIMHNTAEVQAAPIYLLGGWREGESDVGGVTFRNVFISDLKKRPALLGGMIHSTATGSFSDIDGDIHIFNPHGPIIQWDAPTSDISLSAHPTDSISLDYDQVISLP